jgi:hypothetical protein
MKTVTFIKWRCLPSGGPKDTAVSPLRDLLAIVGRLDGGFARLKWR